MGIYGLTYSLLSPQRGLKFMIDCNNGKIEMSVIVTCTSFVYFSVFQNMYRMTGYSDGTCTPLS